MRAVWAEATDNGALGQYAQTLTGPPPGTQSCGLWTAKATGDGSLLSPILPGFPARLEFVAQKHRPDSGLM